MTRPVSRPIECSRPFPTFLKFTVLALAVIISWRCLADASNTLKIAENGQSPYVIVIPDDVDQKRIEKAATLLRDILKESCGAELAIVKESEKSGDGPAFHLGKTKAAKTAGVPVEKAKGWAYVNRTVGNDVFIVGDESDFPLRGSTQGYDGTLKAVVSFLENQLDVRFLLPGEYGRRVPKHDPLLIAADMDETWKPLYDYVIGRSPKRDDAFAAALNLFRRTPILKSYGGHSYYTSVPRDVHAKNHPEYFASSGGVRGTDENHLCISNPEVRELMIQEMERQFDNGYEWVELSQTDGYRPCNCRYCKALHPDESERLWLTHRAIAEEIAKRRPGKKVMIISYQKTGNPPTSFDSFPDNVVVQMCYTTPEKFKDFKPFNVDETVYVYTFHPAGGVWPKRSPRYVIQQNKRFLDNGVRGVYLCGGFTENRNGYGLGGPTNYAFGKALGNPDVTPDEIQKEYVNRLFGEAAGPMRNFYRKLYDRIEAYSLFNRPNVPVGDLPNTMESPEDIMCHCFPPKLLNELTLCLERAKRLAKDERVKAALKMVELEFEQVKRRANVYHVYRAYRANPNQETFDILAKTMEGYRAYLNANDYPKKLPGGLPLVPKSGGKKKKKVVLTGRPPFNWDFEHLKSKGVLPGVVKSKSMEVSPITKVTLDGELNEPAWEEIASHELGGIDMGEVKDATRFKLAYDDEAFYLAAECEYDSPDWMTHLKTTGKDGAAWAQECLELCVDPWGDREKHYQLVFSPAPNSTFDARRGYFNDPLDPMYGKTNVGWNGDWDYAFNIDEKNKRWTAEARIPYATLDVEPPSPGAMWTFNLGRSQWPGGYGKGVILSTWAPNLESKSYHDRANFGEIVFK